MQEVQDNFEAKIATLEDAADLAAEYALPDDAVFDGALATMGAQFATKAASIAMIAPMGALREEYCTFCYIPQGFRSTHSLFQIPTSLFYS